MAAIKCCVCNAPNSTFCAVCQSAAYCSDKCKQDDARTHKLLCEAFAAFDTKKRPSERAVLALYFPITQYGQKGLSAPQITWIDPEHKSGEMHIVEKRADGTIKFTDPLKHDAFEAEFTEPRNMSTPVASRSQEITMNFKKMFRLDHTVVLHMRAAFNFDGSHPNLTLVEITREQLRMRWRGPLVLYSKGALDFSPCKDITLSDFRTFIDFCKVYEGSPTGLADALRTNNYLELELTNPSLFHTLLLHNSNNKTFKGVEIACKADMKFLNMAQFVSVSVPTVHPIFDNVNNNNGLIAGFGATQVSKMIALPLLVRRIFPDKRWSSGPASREDCHNPAAEYLNLNTDVESEGWAARDPGPTIEGQIHGRVLVVREDRLDLTAHQVEAVVVYFKTVCEILAQDKVDRCEGMVGQRLFDERAEMMGESVCRENFEAVFEGCREVKVEGGDASWVDEVSPYEVAGGGGGVDGLGEELDGLYLGSDDGVD